jgi:integrase
VRYGLFPFLDWLEARHLSYSCYCELDALLARYIYLLYRGNKPKGWAANLMSCWNHVDPASKGKLPVAHHAHLALKKSRPCQTRVPITFELTALYACLLCARDKKRDKKKAVALLLGFHTYLRIHELLGILHEHVCFTNDRRGVWATIRLPKTKTGRNQAVTVRDKNLALLLQRLVRDTKKRERVFDFSAETLRRAMRNLNMALAVPFTFTPHCLRHGGATHDYMRGVELQRIQVRGRWKSFDSMQRYIHAGESLLVSMELSDEVRDVSSLVAKDIMTLMLGWVN